MAMTVVVVPMFAPYNQVLLLPAILVLVRDQAFFTTGSRAIRFCYLASALALAWQWIASLCLSVAYFLAPSAWAFSFWKWPFLATFTLPVLVFALIFIEVQGAATEPGFAVRRTN
jgi:hypothetical protein